MGLTDCPWTILLPGFIQKGRAKTSQKEEQEQGGEQGANLAKLTQPQR